MRTSTSVDVSPRVIAMVPKPKAAEMETLPTIFANAV